jgi:hypothetical protein
MGDTSALSQHQRFFFSNVVLQHRCAGKIKGNKDSDHTDISIHRPVPDGRMPSSLT